MQINAVNDRRQYQSSMGIGRGIDATPDISDGPTQIGMISQMGGSRNKPGTAQKLMRDEYSNQDYRDNDSGDEGDHASSIKLKNLLPPLGYDHNMMRNLMNNKVDEHDYATNERSAAAVGESDNLLDQPSTMQQQLMSPDELRFDRSLDSNEWAENLKKQNKTVSIASATRKSNKSAKNNKPSNGYIQQQINMQIQ